MALREYHGVVVKISGNKTIKVEVKRKFAHEKYAKIMVVCTNRLVHDEHNVASVGDHVIIRQNRPISSKKCWILIRKTDLLGGTV